MDPSTYTDPQLTYQDRLVISAIVNQPKSSSNDNPNAQLLEEELSTEETIQKLHNLNDPSHVEFDPTISQFWDTPLLRAKLPAPIQKYVLTPYINWAKDIARYQTDVVMVTHLILYFTTIVPSAAFLYYRFSYLHGALHWLMQLFYCGAFTLMKHQHIHMNGVLAPKLHLFDTLFPYLLDPMHGHTWNSYFYHHIKHHHVEGNGGDDLSTTMYYDRDSIPDFLTYVGRFVFFIWLELPLYFWRKGQFKYAARCAFWEVGNYVAIYMLYNYVNARATTFVLILPLTVMRLGLMVGNWGQHAFVDPADPDSDYLSSITLIDVPSNRFSYNDGYHTSHHLNPRRHWRDHPVAFLKQKDRYAKENALVFRNVDYIFITVNLLRKNYEYLAKCLIPIGDQVNWTFEERVEMLRRRTRKFPKPSSKKSE
ncbi:hypothetical protein N7475_008114 [Penicillium sp. IBT 31633x]|nr:hypothetical protein N7475_008114 [Penicillium sp. IBT 31633x]